MVSFLLADVGACHANKMYLRGGSVPLLCKKKTAILLTIVYVISIPYTYTDIIRRV